MQPRWRDNRTNTHRSRFKLLTGEVKIISVQREEVQTNSGGSSCSVMARATWQRALLWSFPVLFCRFSPHTSCCALPWFVSLVSDYPPVWYRSLISATFVYINEIKEGNHLLIYLCTYRAALSDLETCSSLISNSLMSSTNTSCLCCVTSDNFSLIRSC